MKAYTKPTIEFVELRPEERLACTSGPGNSGCCGTGGGNKGYYWLLSCWVPVPVWILCGMFKMPLNKWC